MRTADLPAPPGPWRPPPRPEPEPAGAASQAAVALLWVYTLGVAGIALDALTLAGWTIGALVAGIGVGLAFDLRRVFRVVSGWVAALLTLVFLLVVLALASRSFDAPFPPATLLVVPLFVRGLDWHVVARLRAMAVLSGVVLVAAMAFGETWVLAAGVLWLLGVLSTLSLLEADRRRSLPPGVVAPGGPAGPDDRLLVTIAAAVGVGLLLTALIGLLSRPDTPDLPRPPFPPAGDLFRLDANGVEQRLSTDAAGRTVIRSGAEEYLVTQEGDRTVVRDRAGNEVATVDGEEVLVETPDGDRQVWGRDAEGRVYLEGDDGQRYVLAERDGRTVLLDEDGREVAAVGGDGLGRGLSPDHLYLRNPDGEVLVPDPDGDGAIPVPPQAVRRRLLGVDEHRTVERDGDTVVVRDRDGTRTYRTDAEGRQTVEVRPTAGGETRTYRFEERDGSWFVHETDRDGTTVRSWVVDPDGRAVGDASGRGASGSGPAGGTPPTTAPDEAGGDGGGPSPWLLVGAVVLAAVAGLGAWLALRRRPDDPDDPFAGSWARALAARLERAGRQRGRPRHPAETVGAYGAALGGVERDHDVAGVGRVLSEAFFDRRPTDPARRSWAEGVVGAMEAAPDDTAPQGWRRRSRRKSSAGTGPGSTPA